MTMKNNANFEEELTGQFKIDIRNLTKFGPSTWKNCAFKNDMKNYSKCAFTCAFKNDMKNYSKFSPKHVWKSKNWKFDGIVLSKVENVWA